jgi:hypothetical protein
MIQLLPENTMNGTEGVTYFPLVCYKAVTTDSNNVYILL